MAPDIVQADTALQCCMAIGDSTYEVEEWADGFQKWELESALQLSRYHTAKPP